MDHDVLKWLHVLSGTLLVGGGFGCAFHLVLASYHRDPAEVASAVHKTLRFDGSVGAATALFQLGGGMLLAHRMGLPWAGGWVAASLALYLLAMLVWVPVVILEFRMRRIAREACQHGGALGSDYWRSFFVWLGLGAFGFLCFALIFWLMLYKRQPFAAV